MKNELFHKNNLDELLYLFRIEKKPFALFIGAGINCFFPKMDWNSLLNYLLNKAVSILAISESFTSKEKQSIFNFLMDIEKDGTSTIKSNFNVYFKASIIKKVLGNQYLSFIQDHLYANCNSSILKKSIDDEYLNTKNNNSLIETADLILNHNNIGAVITYNYDNFLGTAINLLQKKPGRLSDRQLLPIDIYQIIQKYSHDDHTFPIFHVHGFIPPPDQLQVEQAENVVLAYDEYFNNIMEPFSWQTTTQLHYLNNYNVLFIGASLEDWNMLRALSASQKYSNAVKRYALFTNSYFEMGSKQSNFLNRLKANVYSDVGIKPIYTETNDHNEIPKLLNQLNYGRN